MVGEREVGRIEGVREREREDTSKEYSETDDQANFLKQAPLQPRAPGINRKPFAAGAPASLSTGSHPRAHFSPKAGLAVISTA